MNIEKLKKPISDIVSNNNLHLFDLSFETKENVLTILIDEHLELEEIEKLSEEISIFLDGQEIEEDNYILDVSYVGIERPIRNQEELSKAIGNYIHVETKELSLDGDLLEVNNDFITLAYKDKNIKKKQNIQKDKIKNMRYAVKF